MQVSVYVSHIGMCVLNWYRVSNTYILFNFTRESLRSNFPQPVSMMKIWPGTSSVDMNPLRDNKIHRKRWSVWICTKCNFPTIVTNYSLFCRLPAAESRSNAIRRYILLHWGNFSLRVVDRKRKMENGIASKKEANEIIKEVKVDWIAGVDRYKIWIENNSNGEAYMQI